MGAKQSGNSGGEAPTEDPIAPWVAADLQDHLLAVTNDLDHLQTMLSDACRTLMEGFLGAASQLCDLQIKQPQDKAAVARAMRHLNTAAKALQFQDMSQQLIDHTSKRLHYCSDRLANDVFAGDGEGDAVVQAAPLRPNPVTQARMDTGFVELF